MENALIVVAATVLGGALGSFAGVVRDRGWRGSVGGRSRCDSCGRALEWYRLVPVASYVAQRGRCGSCRARIPARVFAIESVGAALGGITAIAVITDLVH